MRKALFISCAVILAIIPSLFGDLSDASQREYGKNVSLSDGICIVRVMTPHGIFSGTAFLLDADRGVYMTAAHVVDQYLLAGFLEFPSLGVREPIQAVWFDRTADIALLGASVPQGVHALTLAPGPPSMGQVVWAMGYHPAERSWFRGTAEFGFKVPLRVVRSATDFCVSPKTCEIRDEIARDIAVKKEVSLADHWTVYPYSIYAEGLPREVSGARQGLVPGMSGGPLLDGLGRAVGINSSCLLEESTCRRAFFAPTYCISEKLAQFRTGGDLN
jgi:S1-C subfamily serine protease